MLSSARAISCFQLGKTHWFRSFNLGGRTRGREAATIAYDGRAQEVWLWIVLGGSLPESAICSISRAQHAHPRRFCSLRGKLVDHTRHNGKFHGPREPSRHPANDEQGEVGPTGYRMSRVEETREHGLIVLC